MNLSTDLLKPVREKGGSLASSRLDYQKDWSLCKLLEVHQTEKDYVLVFEHDDDLLLLDDNDNPKKISFYQVKTKSIGSWKFKDLIKRSTGKTLKFSFLGKLYANKIKYGSKTESLNFISNAIFDIKTQSGDGKKLKEICITDFNKSELKKLSEQIKKEHSLPVDPDCRLIFLKVVDLSLADSSTHTKGKISNFVSKLNPDKNYKPDIMYKTIFDEIRRKSNDSSTYTTFEELKKHKGISRKDFTEMLEAMDMTDDGKKFEDLWEITQQRLNQEKEDVRSISAIKGEWFQYSTNILDASNILHQELESNIKTLVLNYLEDKKEVESLKNFLEIILREYNTTEFNKKHQGVYNNNYIKAVTLGKFYE
jgi:hypothetical protein